MPNIKNGHKLSTKSRRKSRRKSSRKSRRKLRGKSRQKYMKKFKKQYGGIHPSDIITTENRDMHIGRLVQIKIIRQNTHTDLFGNHFTPDLVNKTFKIIDSHHYGQYATDDNFVALEPIHDYNHFFDMDNEPLLITIPSNFIDIRNIPYIVKLISFRNIFTRDNINRSTAARQDFRRRKGLALTEHPAETEVIPSHSARRATNPMPFDASVIINTKDGPLQVQVPENIMKKIKEYM